MSAPTPPSGGTPRLSIVIVGYGKAHLSAACLASLETAYGSELGRSVELVLVDNASPDGGETAALFRSWDDRATVILEPTNRNYAGGNNDGARAARGDILVFLNNDTVVPPGALDPIVELAGHADVGGVGIRLLYPNRTIQHAGVAWRDDSPYGGGLEAFHLFQHEPGDLPVAQARYDLDVVTAACLAVRREVFLDLGGFDESFVNGYEDVDLCLRMRAGGLRIVYSGTTHVVHDESATRGHGWNMAENDRLLRNRWEALLGDDDETMGRLFDARLDADRPGGLPCASPVGATVVVEGPAGGVSAAGAESRALAAGLECAGLGPAVRDTHEAFVGPRTDESWRRLSFVFRRRRVAADAVAVHVAAGGFGPPPPRADVLRLAHVPDRLPPVAAIWAATPELVDELTAAGAPAQRIEWVPPFVPPVLMGAGGGGLVVVLPATADDAQAALAAAAGWAGPVSVLPSASSAVYETLVAEVLPSAKLLSPITCELRFAALAAEADAVLCADATDLFQRRALLAAAAGAAPVVASGAAAAVLGADAPAQLAAVTLAPSDRARRAATVAAACGADALAPRLAALVEDARALAYRPLRRAA